MKLFAGKDTPDGPSKKAKRTEKENIEKGKAKNEGRNCTYAYQKLSSACI